MPAESTWRSPSRAPEARCVDPIPPSARLHVALGAGQEAHGVELTHRVPHTAFQDAMHLDVISAILPI
jgi:hypothetical protein